MGFAWLGEAVARPGVRGQEDQAKRGEKGREGGGGISGGEEKGEAELFLQSKDGKEMLQKKRVVFPFLY